MTATLAGVLPEGQSVVITVTAPIKRPAKTAETLEHIVRDGLAHGELCKTIHGNKVRVRPITHVATNMPKVLAFVHITEADAGLILNIAESLGRIEVIKSAGRKAACSNSSPNNAFIAAPPGDTANIMAPMTERWWEALSLLP